MGQTITGEPDLDSAAEKYGISHGKAALIRKLERSDARFRFEDLVGLSINDINLLIEGRRDAVQGISSSGKAAPGEYIGEDKAAAIAFEAAGVEAADALKLEAVMEYESGMMVYDVNFHAGGKEHEYEIDAATGQIVSSENEADDESTQAEQAQRIGKESALKIALRHAGFSAEQVTRVHTSVETEGGRTEYSVEFFKDNIEYEYDIDAVSGKIIGWDSDYSD